MSCSKELFKSYLSIDYNSYDDNQPIEYRKRSYLLSQKGLSVFFLHDIFLRIFKLIT